MALSYSQLSTYRRCPKQYEFTAVKKIPRRISSGESFGSSIHNTLKRWGELEILLQQDAPLKKQLKLFAEHEDEVIKKIPLELATLLGMFRECFIAEGYENRAAMDSGLLRGESVLRKFFDWWKREKRTVVSVESSFKLEIGPVVLSGRFDRIERSEGGLVIIDYKTSDPRSQESVDNDLQLSIYALAASKEGEKVDCLRLLFLGEDEVIERKTSRNESQLKDAITAIRLLNEGIEGKDFKATPTREKCRGCPYREICTSALR